MTDQGQYDLFRKKFHIPSKWQSSEPIVNLIRFNYSTNDLASPMSEIESLFQRTPYNNLDNNQMLHDYLYFLILDMLRHKEIAYIEENDLKSSAFLDLLTTTTTSNSVDVHTPDILIKRGKRCGIICDVYIGYESSVIEKKKEKYNSLLLGFDSIVIITQTSIVKSCLDIGLDDYDADYVLKNFLIFKAEFTYWVSCRKMNKILRNESGDNVEFRDLSFRDTFESDLQRYKDDVLRKLQSLQ